MRRSRIILILLVLAIVGISGYKAWIQKQIDDQQAALTGGKQAAHDHSNGLPCGMVLSGAELDTALKSGLPTLVEFGKDSCKACELMAPRLEKAAKDFADKAYVVSVNTGQFGELTRTHKVSGIPTQLIFDAAGKEVFRNQGCMEQADIDKQLQQAGAK